MAVRRRSVATRWAVERPAQVVHALLFSDGWGRTPEGSRRSDRPAQSKAELTDARLCHPLLRINRVLRVMLHARWSGEAWAVVRVEFRRALALRAEIRRATTRLGFAERGVKRS